MHQIMIEKESKTTGALEYQIRILLY
jgi:hypothetical protein